MQTFNPGKHTCPHCNHEMDCSATASEGSKGPGDGDVGVCIRCVRPFFYTVKDGEFGTRIPSREERDELSKDEDVSKAIGVLLRIKARRQSDLN